MGMIVISFPSCNGIFEGIYDHPNIEEDAGNYGFIKMDDTTRVGTIYIDSSSYSHWTFINFHNQSIVTRSIQENEKAPEAWDIAIHRYDAKTNGAEVMEISFRDFIGLQKATSAPQGTYVKDVKGKVMVDISGMLEGNVIYAESEINRELSKWLNVDTSTMPPVYTLSHKIYIIKLRDNTLAAVKLVNFMNKVSDKGFMTINYIYPFHLKQ